MQTCKQCRYFKELFDEGKETEFGICLALPPNVVMVNGLIQSGIVDGIQSVYPQVSEKRLPCTLFKEKGKNKVL